MKLILAIVSNDDCSSVLSSLNSNSFQVTKLATTGGFLSLGNTTLIIGCEDDKVEKAVELIGNESRRRTEIAPSSAAFLTGEFSSIPLEVTVGGATIFVLDVDKFYKL